MNAEPLRLMGRKSLDLTVDFVRELSAPDLQLLQVERGVKPKPLHKVRDSHHSLARALAQGLSNTEASRLTGYTPSRISVLRTDQLFQKLIDEYSGERRLAEASLLERMTTLSLDVVEEIRSRLDEDPDSLKTRELLDVFTALADRSGHGPTSKQQISHLAITPADLERLSKAIDYAEGVTIVEATAHNIRTSDGGAHLGLSLASTEVARSEGEGESLPKENLSASLMDAEVGGVR